MMPGREWSTKYEIPILKRVAPQGAVAVVAALAEAGFERSVDAVKAKAGELGVSLRRPGVRRGLVMGQPRSVSLTSVSQSREIRELVVSRRIDMSVVLQRMSLQISGEAEMCPHCGKRPIEQKSRFGLCAVCHKEELIESLNAELTLIETKKVQQNVWQDKSRAKCRRCRQFEAVAE